MKQLLATLLLAACGLAAAETPQQIADGYAAEAAKTSAGFQASAQRGSAFFSKKFAVSDRMPACASCHTDSPLQPGRHAITGKDIKPLAPAANAGRFTDPAKVEKWFGRNCKEVVGRECSAAEKADFVQFLAEAR